MSDLVCLGCPCSLYTKPIMALPLRQMYTQATYVAVAVLCVALCSTSSAQAQLSNLPLTADLTGNGWTIKNGNGSITLDGSIPGYALEALQASGKVPNPLERCVVRYWASAVVM